jgi:hypothetical protein
MASDHDHFRRMAAEWRSLAEIGDPARRAERERWAKSLERLADSAGEANQRSGAEEKKP